GSACAPRDNCWTPVDHCVGYRSRGVVALLARTECHTANVFSEFLNGRFGNHNGPPNLEKIDLNSVARGRNYRVGRIMAQQRTKPKKKSPPQCAAKSACSYAARFSIFLCISFLCFLPHFAIS